MSEQIQEMAEHLKQWVIGVDRQGETILPKARFSGPANRNFNLKGRQPRKFLQHETQKFGINLGWTDDCSPSTGRRVARWFFASRRTNDCPICYGDTIAIGVGTSPSFIRYKKRTIGINLDWSKTPVFEWKILGGKPGDPVKTGRRIAIYNTKVKEAFVYFDRTAGGDVGWPSSKTFTEQIKERAWDWAKSRVRRAVYNYLTGGLA